MGNIYRPVINPDRHVIKFTRQELMQALRKLEQNGAQEIGIELEKMN